MSSLTQPFLGVSEAIILHSANARISLVTCVSLLPPSNPLNRCSCFIVPLVASSARPRIAESEYADHELLFYEFFLQLMAF